MTDFPISQQRQIKPELGRTIGTSFQWFGGQYCAIHTANGVVGCGIYDLACANEFGMAFAIAKGTPEHPLRQPEDLLDARIIGVSNKAAEFGIAIGMSGLEAVEKMSAGEIQAS